MSRSLELMLARRLAWKLPGQRRVNPAVGVAVAGVALAVVVMLLSVSVMIGFRHEVESQILRSDDAITFTAFDTAGRPATFNPDSLLAILDLPGQISVVPHININGILKTADDFMGLSMTGDASRVPSDSIGSIVLSAPAASRLGLAVGDKVTAHFFIDNRLRSRSLRIADTFTPAGDMQTDATAYCSPGLPASLLNMPPGHVHSLGLRDIALPDIGPLADNIHSRLLDAYYTGIDTRAYGMTTILQTGSQYFAWLTLLDTNVAVILILMSGIAAFTLISSLFIIILERVRTIGLLKALGAGDKLIRRTFMLMAERLVLRGLAIGNCIALALIAIQMHTRVLPLDPASYYIDFVPVGFSWTWLIGLNIGAIALSWAVLMLPAMLVSRISPAATMRYE